MLDTTPPGASARAVAATVPPGGDLTVYGHWYAATCNDTSITTADPAPMPPVHLTLKLPGQASRDVGIYTPGGQDLGFAATVHVPTDAQPGAGTLSDGLSHHYRFEIAGP